jgi:hypothetical protein
METENRISAKHQAFSWAFAMMNDFQGLTTALRGGDALLPQTV